MFGCVCEGPTMVPAAIHRQHVIVTTVRVKIAVGLKFTRGET